MQRSFFFFSSTSPLCHHVASHCHLHFCSYLLHYVRATIHTCMYMYIFNRALHSMTSRQINNIASDNQYCTFGIRIAYRSRCDTWLYGIVVYDLPDRVHRLSRSSNDRFMYTMRTRDERFSPSADIPLLGFLGVWTERKCKSTIRAGRLRLNVSLLFAYVDLFLYFPLKNFNSLLINFLNQSLTIFLKIPNLRKLVTSGIL